MALIACPECGREISDKAAHCIHCGCPIAQQHETSNDKPKFKIDNVNIDSSKFKPVPGAPSIGGDDASFGGTPGKTWNCPTCGKALAPNAKFCPNCGRSKPFELKWTLILIGIIVLVLFLFSHR